MSNFAVIYYFSVNLLLTDYLRDFCFSLPAAQTPLIETEKPIRLSTHFIIVRCSTRKTGKNRSLGVDFELSVFLNQCVHFTQANQV